jgi:uncharacterized membrane protein YfcA
MDFLWFCLSGVLGGVLGGMGMGGGTILIPLITIFLGVNQHMAQGINLLSFVPMAVVALILHVKNGYVKFDKVVYIILSGVVTAILGFFVANLIRGEILKRLFGGFLIFLSILQFIILIKHKK